MWFVSWQVLKVLEPNLKKPLHLRSQRKCRR